ncbi:hypothetical protein DM02DRAFT_718963 [Periconia macrospinosa]|uniref:CoA-dependent acyltransferase n=1 Tax=Periconia macrospinosa TaxID=97972 RepID=A0A2V1DLW0_9PLEO|nr:hypothetical protein DM02DRAFT_718963 [Periconia macrospinosa]
MPPYTRSSHNERLFTRPLGPNETYINLVANLTPSPNRKGWYMHSFATIKPRGTLTSSLLPIILRKAWANLRFQQPSVAAYLTADEKHLAYQVPSSKDLEEWLDESFAVDKESEDAQTVIRSPRVPKYWTCTFIEKSQEVLCHTAHWRSDGIGVLQLLDALFSLVADAELQEPEGLPWGEEVSRLALSIEDVAAVPEHENKQQKEFAQTCLSTFGLTEGAVGIPYIENSGVEGGAMPGGTLIARTKFSEETTAEVVSRCKELGISVTSAVNSSIAAANWAFASADRKNQHYTSTARFSFKPYLSAPYNGPAYASALLTTGWMVSVNPRQSWEERARYYNSVYRAGISKDFIAAYRVYAQSICDAIAHAPKVVSPAAEVDISSIGVIEKHIKREYGDNDRALEVLDVGEGVETLGRSCGLFVWTFRNRLVLSVVFNEEFHRVKQMEAFNEAVKEDLLRELSIQSYKG